MADDNRWSDRDRDRRDDRSWEGRDRGRSGYYGGGREGGGDFGRGGQGNRGYQSGGSSQDRWRQMHQDRRHEGPAGYNDSGPVQGGWEFGDEAQGGERGQGYERYGYGRGASGSQRGSSGSDYERGVTGYGETYGSGRDYGRGGGYASQGQDAQRWRSSTDRRGYGETYGGAGYGGFSSRNEYDERGRGGEYADDSRREGEGRSWLERAGDRVAGFFGADDTGSHRGRGPKGYRRSDDRIRDDINDRLTDDAWLDASNIEVQVRETEVILSGAVNSREDKRRAEDLAESISGVRNVLNNLRVEGQDAQATTTGRTMGTTTSSTVQDVASGKDQKGLGAGRQASTD